MSDDEYMSRTHNPDMSDAAWDKRWEKAKEVKLKAREKERKKLLGDDDNKLIRKEDKFRDDSRVRIDSRSNKRRHEDATKSSDDEELNPKRNKEQERRRKRAKEYLQPSIKKPQIYPLINGQVRSTEAGELTILPRNHNLENDIEDNPKIVKQEMERKRKTLSNQDCGLSISEYKTMMTQPKDPTRNRRWHHERQEELEEAYGLRFPACFFAMYEFALTVDPHDPMNCMTKIGLVLTGAFPEFHKMCQNKGYVPDPENKVFRNLVHRQYYDPPEMQVLLVNLKDKSHLGYWRDDPQELPPFIAMNDGNCGKLYAVGPNLMASVKLWLYRRVGSQTLHTRKCFATISDVALKWNIIIERVTYELRERETRCNARTLNTVGISVPITTDTKGNEIGYRPMDVNDDALLRILNSIEAAPNDQMRLDRFRKLQEIFQRIQLANDECDFGMGLEFGISLFTHGSKYFHKMILKVIPLAYELLNRPLYGEIIKCHLADRRKLICDRYDIAPKDSNQIGPTIGTYRVVEPETTPAFARRPPSDPVIQKYPDEGPSYMDKLKHKGSASTYKKDSANKGGASDWS